MDNNKINKFGFNRVNNLLLLIFISAFTSCDSYLELDNPVDELPSDVVFSDYTTAQAAMTNIYSELRDNVLLTGSSQGLGVLMGLYADELDLYNTEFEIQQNFEANTIHPSDFSASLFWGETYRLIYSVNSVLEGVQQSQELKLNEKEQLMGEALFTRALLHFYLVNLYDAVPYIESTNYRINQEVSRLPVAKVYEKIIVDLEEAKELLGQDYLTSFRIRPNYWVASALLSRVYLYSQEYIMAAEEAENILNNDRFTLENNFENVFKKGSSGTIWQLMAVEGGNAAEGQAYIFPSAPPPSIALTQDLVDSFGEEDQRKMNWIKEVEGINERFYHAFKYKAHGNTGTSDEFSIVFRLAEQYLIFAEAQAHLGNLDSSLLALNAVRTRAGLLVLSGLSQEEVLNAIQEERRWELFTEFGHRFFDLKRTSRADIVLESVKVGWNSSDVVLPIPQAEIDLNPNLLPQNNGY